MVHRDTETQRGFHSCLLNHPWPLLQKEGNKEGSLGGVRLLFLKTLCLCVQLNIPALNSHVVALKQSVRTLKQLRSNA